MKWLKKGIIFNPKNNFPWMRSYASLPIADKINNDRFRIFFSTRNSKNQSLVGFIEIDMYNPTKILRISKTPVLSPGKIGTFDDSGAMAASIVNHKNKKYMYYIGWNQGKNIPFRWAIGLAITCVTGSEELFNLLKSFRKDSVRIDRTIVDPDFFNRNLKSINIKKNKFTFFCPTRIGSEKGIDLLWKAVNLCTTDFDILQINWLDTKNPKIQKESEQILKNKPNNVYLIDKIKYDDMGRYYTFADCILGEMKTGHTNSVEREAALCHKPILNYNNIQTKSFIDGKELVTPFLPQSNHPKEIAKLIDMIVVDKEFRESLAEEEYIFMKNLTDPQKTAMEWKDLIKNLT